MDPTCGHCLGSSCGGFSGFRDPGCPEHGVVAHAIREAKLDEDIAGLNRRSLLALVRKNMGEKRTPLEKHMVLHEDPPEKIIRETSAHMLSRAGSGFRRVRLFTVQLSGEMQKPEQALSETQRKVCQYFEERKLHIVFRENWNALSPEFAVFAVW